MVLLLGKLAFLLEILMILIFLSVLLPMVVRQVLDLVMDMEQQQVVKDLLLVLVVLM